MAEPVVSSPTMIDGLSGVALLPTDGGPAGPPVDLSIRDGRIVAITPAARPPSRRLLAMPALVNAHDHVRPLSPTSFGAAGKPLETWLLRLAAMPTIDPYLGIVNIGDCLMRWTNDIYVSTPHRVVNRSPRERYSIAFFYDPNPDAIVETIPSCVRQGGRVRYPPILAADHLKQRLDASKPVQVARRA